LRCMPDSRKMSSVDVEVHVISRLVVEQPGGRTDSTLVRWSRTPVTVHQTMRTRERMRGEVLDHAIFMVESC
jgi:hypothetical protein